MGLTMTGSTTGNGISGISKIGSPVSGSIGISINGSPVSGSIGIGSKGSIGYEGSVGFVVLVDSVG